MASHIELNGKIFTQGEAAFTDTLFNPINGRTASGWFKRLPAGGITLFDATGKRVGGVNRFGVLHSSTQCSDGKWWHSYAEPAVVGLHDSYSVMVRESRAAVGLAAY